MRKDRQALVALSWVVAVLVVAYLPLFLGEIIFFRDQAHWNYSARWFVRASVLRGDPPWWNPEQGLGFSVLANPLYGLFYPPSWLFLLVPADRVASMLGWQSFAHVVWGSAGMVVLARQLRVPSTGTTVAGLAWGLSGFTTSAWSAGLLVLSGAWIPWCAVGFVRLARQARQPARADDRAWWVADLVPAALPVAMAILLGEVFSAIMAVGFGAAVAAVALHHDLTVDPGLRERVSRSRANWRVAGALALAVGLAAAVGAVVVVPARAIAAATERARPLVRALAEVGSLRPLRMFELAAPGSMGHPFFDYPASPWVGEPGIDGLPLMYSIYLGASVVALVWLAFGRGRRLAAWLALIAAAALVISLGRYTPIHHWLRTVVRPLSYMRYPEKYLVLFVAAVALLAGLGAARILGQEPPGSQAPQPQAGPPAASHPAKLPWRRTAVWLALLAGLAAAAVPAFPEGWGHYMRAGAGHGAVAVALVLLVQLLPPQRARIAAGLLVAGVGADLAIAAWPHLGFGARAVAVNVPRAAAAIVADHRRGQSALAPPRLYRAQAVETTTKKFVPARNYPEGQMRSMHTLVQNAVTTFGVATVPGYDAAIPSALPELWVLGQKAGLGQNVLRLLGIDYAILPIEDPANRTERRRGIEPMLDPLPGARLYRVPGALPRVYLAARAELVPDDQVRRRLLEADVVAGGLALLAAPGAGASLPLPLPPAQALAAAPPGRAGDCELRWFSNVRVVATCRAQQRCIAVFNEQHDAGWTADVDGTAEPVLRANLLMRAVQLDRGTHTVTLSYTPPGLRTGGVVSLASLCVLGGCAVAPLVRRRWRAARRS